MNCLHHSAALAMRQLVHESAAPKLRASPPLLPSVLRCNQQLVSQRSHFIMGSHSFLKFLSIQLSISLLIIFLEGKRERLSCIVSGLVENTKKTPSNLRGSIDVRHRHFFLKVRSILRVHLSLLHRRPRTHTRA